MTLKRKVKFKLINDHIIRSKSIHGALWSLHNKLFLPISYKLYLKNNVLHLHIPKTGGTYISQYESDSNSVISPVFSLGHAYISRNNINPIYEVPYYNKHNHPIFHPDNLVNKFVFCTVRNIHNWLVSYFVHSGGESSNYLNKEHYDYSIAQKGFDYFIKHISDRTDLWPNRKFIFCQAFDDDGNLAVDWINRTESLDEDLEELAKLKSLKYLRKRKQRKGGIVSYENYYNTELYELVNTTWAREIELYGYSVQNKLNNTPLYRLISADQKAKISYNYKTDEFHR